MVNTNELRAAWVKKGLTQADIAKELKISPRTLTNRMKKGVFGSDEIEQLITLLDIQNPVPIFFAQSVT